jgi:hypothetical protein
MDRRRFLLTSLAGVLAAPLAVEGQQQGKVYRMGVLERTSPALNAANFDAFRQGLQELGYVRVKTSSSSTDQPKAALNGSRTWRLSW